MIETTRAAGLLNRFHRPSRDSAAAENCARSTLHEPNTQWICFNNLVDKEKCTKMPPELQEGVFI
jgi:hypothetical protein